MEHDVIVIGGGPAGLAATTWLARYRRRVLLLDEEKPRNRWVEHAHGYLGFDPCSPQDLRDRALRDLQRYDTVEVRCVRADGVLAEDGCFRVGTPEEAFRSQRLILATGIADAFPEVEGFFTHYGASVFHCPTCDGYEARDQRVVVFGWTEQVAGFALSLLDWAAEVTIVTNGQSFDGGNGHREALARHGVAVLEDDAVALVGERGDLRCVRLRAAGDLSCTLAFFSIGHHPVTGIAEQLGCDLDDQGHVIVDEHGLTSVPGVYAAGDLTPGMQLISIAAAQGTTAGIACALSLRGDQASSASDAPDVEQELPH